MRIRNASIELPTVSGRVGQQVRNRKSGSIGLCPIDEFQFVPAQTGRGSLT
jgi:hypothetical protein